MAEQIPEIYADETIGFTINKDGTIAKLILASARPNGTGGIELVPVGIVMMTTPAMQKLLNEINEAVGSHQQETPAGPKN